MAVRVLIAYATRMGSTAETALVIGEVMTRAGFLVTVSPCSDALDADHYDAVIVGSAVHLGQWAADALDYLERHAPALQLRPAWLFQIEPCREGAEYEPLDVPDKVLKLARRLGIAPPITFGVWRLPAETPGPLSRWLARGSVAEDFRNWAQVRAWAAQKADLLRSLPPEGLSPELAAALGSVAVV